MSGKNSIGIKSVQIIRIEGSKFIFDCEALQNIVNQNEECSDLPVCVIIINGALRTGKSFFSNFIIRHMRKLENEILVHGKLKCIAFFSKLVRSAVHRPHHRVVLGMWAANVQHVRSLYCDVSKSTTPVASTIAY